MKQFSKMITEDDTTFYKDVRFWVVLVSMMTLVVLSSTIHQTY